MRFQELYKRVVYRSVDMKMIANHIAVQRRAVTVGNAICDVVLNPFIEWTGWVSGEEVVVVIAH